MKRLPWLLLALVVIALGYLWRAEGARRAVAETVADQAQQRADSIAVDAATARAAAAIVRQERDRYREATTEASAVTARTQRAASTLAQAALGAAQDSSVQADSLRGLIRALARAIHADSAAHAARESAWLARGVHYEGILVADSLALRTAWAALRAEQASHAATKAIPRRGLVSRLAPYVAVAGVSWLAGRLDLP